MEREPWEKYQISIDELQDIEQGTVSETPEAAAEDPEAERLRRERKRAYDRERYRRRKAAQTPEAAEIERINKKEYDRKRYLARKQRAAAAPPPPGEAAARIRAEG